MILSNIDIQQYLDAGTLVITPLRPDCIRECGIDLYMKMPLHCLNINMSSKWLCHGWGHLSESEAYIEMPNNLMAFVGIRSTWARKGVFPPETRIEPGWKGTLTIELFNGGPDIYLGIEPQRIVTLTLMKIKTPGKLYQGKYQNQNGITLAKEDTK